MAHQAHLSSLRSSLHQVLRQAPFGDKPDELQPPFSASQLSSYFARVDAQTAPPSPRKLQRLCLETVHDLESRSSKGVASRLEALAAAGPDGHPAQEPWASLPSSLKTILWLRHGPATHARALSEHSASAATSTLPNAVAAFEPLARIAERASGWQALLGIDSGKGEAGPSGDNDAKWPDAQAWRRLTVRTLHFADDDPWLPRSARRVSSESSSASTLIDGCDEEFDGLAVSLTVEASAGGMWEVRMRAECMGMARSVRRVSLAEQLDVDSHLPWVNEQLHSVATRDVYLSPPALLYGPGCFLEACVLLPMGEPSEAPPKMRVVDVVQL